MAAFLLDDLKFYFQCEEPSGTRVDSGPNGLDVPEFGNVPSVAGALGSAVNGTGNPVNYLEAPHNDAFRVGNNPFTLSYWQYIPAGTFTENHPAAAHWDNSANQRSWLAYMRNANDRHTFEVSGDGVSSTRVSWTQAPVPDSWEHIVCRYDPIAGTIGISVNRGPFETVPFSGGIFDATAAFNLTAMHVSSFVVGLGDVDEVGAWDRLLSDNELDTLFGSGTPPAFDTFVGSDDDDEGDDEAVVDDGAAAAYRYYYQNGRP